jgi:hypothetical protein
MKSNIFLELNSEHIPRCLSACNAQAGLRRDKHVSLNPSEKSCKRRVTGLALLHPLKKGRKWHVTGRMHSPLRSAGNSAQNCEKQ